MHKSSICRFHFYLRIQKEEFIIYSVACKNRNYCMIQLNKLYSFFWDIIIMQLNLIKSAWYFDAETKNLDWIKNLNWKMLKGIFSARKLYYGLLTRVLQRYCSNYFSIDFIVEICKKDYWAFFKFCLLDSFILLSWKTLVVLRFPWKF